MDDMGAPSLWLPETSARDLCRAELRAVSETAGRGQPWSMVFRRTRKLKCRLLMISIALGYCWIGRHPPLIVQHGARRDTLLAVHWMNSQQTASVPAGRIAATSNVVRPESRSHGCTPKI